MSLRAKDHLEGTKVAAFPRYCAPQKVQTGSAAAGGHQGVATRKATGRPGLPTEERATQRARESSMWVRVTVTSKKARRTGAVKLLRYAACYGRWLLSKARPPPSPSGLREGLECLKIDGLKPQKIVFCALVSPVGHGLDHESQKNEVYSPSDHRSSSKFGAEKSPTAPYRFVPGQRRTKIQRT